jgi:ATP-binding cassette, subfamily B, multidrug efflux pump
MPWVDLAHSDAQDKSSTLKDLVYLKRLWPYIKAQWRLLLPAVLLLPVLAGAQVLLPKMVQWTIDGPVTHGELEQLWLYTAGFMGLVVVHHTARYWHLVLAQLAGQGMIHQLRCALFDHIVGLSWQYLNDTPVGKLVTRLTSDMENINEVFASGCIGMVADLCVILGILGTMGFVEWRLTLGVLVLAPLLILTIEWFRSRSRAAYNAIRVHQAEITISLQETVSGIEVVQALQQESRRKAHFETHAQAYSQANLRSVIYDSSFTAVIELYTYVTMLVVLAVFLLSQSSPTPISFGVLLAFIYFVQMIFEPIELMTDKFTFLQSGLASVEKILDIFDEARPPLILEGSSPQQLPTGEKRKSTAAVVFDAVDFAYVPGKPVLKQFSLTIEPGEKVAIIGRTGAGKSTLIRLLGRHYVPNAGQIRLYGVPLNQLETPVIRQTIGLIPQEDFLFSTTLRDNITLIPGHKGDTLDAELTAILERVGAAGLLQRLPEGLDTLLPERGRSLSNGERQLVVFARALYHNPEILVLDEATSAIDSQTEQQIQTALIETLQSRTAILIAHRLSTVQFCDRVILLRNGQMIQAGTPEEVLTPAVLEELYAPQTEEVQPVH